MVDKAFVERECRMVSIYVPQFEMESAMEFLCALLISKEKSVRKNPWTIKRIPIKEMRLSIAIKGLRKINMPTAMLSSPASNTTPQNL